MEKESREYTMNSLASKSITGTFWVFLGSYSVTLINFIVGIVLARILAPADFGVLALAVFYLTAFSVLKDWGVESALLYRKENLRETASTLFFLQIGLASLSVLLALTSSFLLRKIYDPVISSILIVLAVFAVIESLGSIPRTLIEKQIAFRGLSLIEVLAVSLAGVLSIVLAVKGLGIWALVFQRVLTITIKTTGFWLLSHFRPLLIFDKVVVSWFFKTFGAPIFISSLASLFLFQFDNFLIGTLVGATVLGFYTKAYQFASLPTQLITQVISRVAFPIYSQCQDDKEKLGKAFSIFLKGIWRLALPMAVGLFVLAPEIIELLLGEKWLPAVPLLRILAGYSLARILLDDTGPLFSGGLGKPKITTRILMIQAILLVVLGFVTTYFFHATGTAMAVNLVMLVGVLLAYQQINQELNLDLTKIFLVPIIAGAGMITAGFFVGNFTEGASLLVSFMAKAVIISLVYTLILLIGEGKRLLEEVRQLRSYVS